LDFCRYNDADNPVSQLVAFEFHTVLPRPDTGFFAISKPDAEHYEELLLKTLDDMCIDFQLCRGQTYDNAAAMSGRLTGLQARLLARNPKATFINCDNHSLNLAALHAAEVDSSITSFFGTMQELFNFFAHSPQRWEKMQTVCKTTLKSESATRWSAREKATRSLSASLDEVIEVLDSMSKDAFERPDTRGKCETLLQSVLSYNFFVYLEFWTEVQSMLFKKGFNPQQ
jgi:hypothetical protein